MKVTDQLKIINKKIKANQAQYNLDRLAAKISGNSSDDLRKCEYLTGFFDMPIKIGEETYEQIIEMRRSNDYMTGNLLGYEYFSKHYKLVLVVHLPETEKVYEGRKHRFYLQKCFNASEMLQKCFLLQFSRVK